MPEMLLEVRDLTATFDSDEGKLVAVDGVSFSIGKGETVGVVGESGCGKSVTSLCIVRLIESNGGRIAGGEILFKGSDLCTKSKQEMRQINGNQISMIFQEPMSSLNPMLTIGWQLIETIRRHQRVDKKTAVAQAEEMLSLVGISDAHGRMAQYAFQLSGGQRQRVMIAMALSCNPDLLIADEPTTALDVTIQAQILDLMKALQARLGMSMLLITHDLGVVADMAERVVVMYGGQIVEQGAVRDIFKAPQHPYTQGLLLAIPKMTKGSERLYMIPGSIPSATDYPPGCRFAARCSHCRELCRRQMPPVRRYAPEHQVRCWRHTEDYEVSGQGGEASGQ